MISCVVSRITRTGSMLLRYGTRCRVFKQLIIVRFMSNKQPPPRPRYSKRSRLMEHNIPKPDVSKKAIGTIFISKSRDLLQTLYDGLIHLEEVNKDTQTNVSIELDYNISMLSIIIGTNTADFRDITMNEMEWKITCDDKTNEVSVFSPVSYGQTYVYFAIENEWKSILDGHNILQLIATEINAHCQGYPRF
eukprot:419187_1